MKGKPIEPGCLAMIVGSIENPGNNGRTVRVVRRAAPFEPPEEVVADLRIPPGYDPDARRWWIEALPGNPPLDCTTRGVKSGRKRLWKVKARALKEKFLIRLDDDEAPQETVSTAHTKDLDEVI